MGAIMSQQLMQAAQIMEDQVDDEIHKLERMDEDELEILKQRRIGGYNILYLIFSVSF